MDLTTLVERLEGLNEDTDLKDIFNEEEINALVENIDQLDELSRATIKSYFNKALDNVAQRASASGRRRKGDDLSGRYEGISRAAKRLPKRGMYKKTAEKLTAEDFDDLSDDELENIVENIDQLDELSRGTLLNYIRAANHRGHAERIKQGQTEADRTYYATGRRTKDKDFYRDQSEKKSNQYGKKAWQRQLGIDRAIDRLAKEDVDQLDELSKAKLQAYIDNAVPSMAQHAKAVGRSKNDITDAPGHLRKALNRKASLKLAGDKLTRRGKYNKTANEDVDQLDELSRGLLARYVKKAGGLGLDSVGQKGIEYGKGQAKLKRVISRAKGIERAADRLANEDVDQLSLFETLASDTLVAGAAPGETKTSYIQQLIAATPNMSIDDLSHLLNQALELSTNQNGDSAAGVVDKNRASIAIKSAVKEDIDSIFNGQDLSEDFKEKIATLFETAVHARVNEAIIDLTEQYDELFEDAVQAVHDDLAEEVDVYLDQFTEDFMNENEVAIESNIRTQLAESFLEGLKDLFEEHYVDMPEGREDVLEALAEDNERLNEKVHELMLELNEVNDIKIAAIKENIIDEAADGLTLADAERLKTLSEAVEFDGDINSFATKVGYIKENYFKRKPNVSTNLLTEQFEGGEEVHVPPMMKLYADVIGHTTKQ